MAYPIKYGGRVVMTGHMMFNFEHWFYWWSIIKSTDCPDHRPREILQPFSHSLLIPKLHHYSIQGELKTLKLAVRKTPNHGFWRREIRAYMLACDAWILESPTDLFLAQDFFSIILMTSQHFNPFVLHSRVVLVSSPSSHVQNLKHANGCTSAGNYC